MGAAAAILGSIGGLSAIYGILIATDALPSSATYFKLDDWEFWMALAGVLLLASIAFLVGRGRAGGEEEYD